MRVAIIGAGEVGRSIAANLSTDHDVVVVDCDSTQVEQLQFELDVLTVEGDGTSLETLQTANIGRADLCVACTDNDRVNLVACGTAKALGEPFTIARTKDVEYLRTWEHKNGAFGADYVVCSDFQTAESIVRMVGLPAAVDVDTFVGGLVHMAEFEIPESSPVAGQTVAKADRFDSLTFAGLFREDTLLIPEGETVIAAGDRAVVIGSPDSVRSFGADIVSTQPDRNQSEVVVVGGSEIGYHTARLLESRRLDIRLIEPDPDRARELAEKLPETAVLNHEPTDTEFLTREHIDSARTLIVTMEADERCLLMSVLAKRIGIERVIAVVEDIEYVTLFEEIGIDVAINPREVTAEEINRFRFERTAENIAVIENDRAEVLEFKLEADSEFVGRSLATLDAEIESPFVVGSLVRDGTLLTPRGETTFRAGDHIVVFVETARAEELISRA